MTITGNVCAPSELSSTLLELVQKKIGVQKFEAWFKHGASVKLEENCVKIGAPNPFVAGWIESHFADVIIDAAQEIAGQRPRLVINVDPVLSGSLRKRQLDAQARLVSRSTSGQARHSGPAPTRQRLRYTLKDFIVGPCNQLAFTAAETVAKTGKGPFNPLFIHGTCGVGKTHLLQGICNGVASLTQEGKDLNWKYTTAEQFTNEFVNAIRTKKLETFRRSYRDLDVLVIDDVHFLSGKKATQEEFLHTFNSIDAAGRQVIMASDAHPRMVGQLAEQLVSRFLSGMVVKIETPDRATRLTILQKFAARLNLNCPLEVLEYVADQIRGSVRELEGALVKLSALMQLTHRQGSLDLAREALAEHLSHTGSATSLGEIEAVVSSFFGITPADIHSTRRTHTISLARSLAMYLARRRTHMSYPEIGRFMGKNHSSAVLAVQKLERLAKDNKPCRWMSAAGPKEMPIRSMLELLTEQVG